MIYDLYFFTNYCIIIVDKCILIVRFSFTWDCDPLIPLSVWVSLLLTLLMASILIWAIQMLSALSVPNKWDDPKKPGIQVAQTE